MTLAESISNKALRDLQENFNEEAWELFHNGTINNEDDFHEYFMDYINNSIIYYSDCDAILDGNSEYHYDEHDVWGRPSNSTQAAGSCLYDFLQESDDSVCWSELEAVLNESNQD